MWRRFGSVWRCGIILIASVIIERNNYSANQIFSIFDANN